MTTVQPKLKEPVKNENLKNLKPIHGKTATATHAGKTTEQPKISETAKTLNANSPEGTTPSTSTPETPSTPAPPATPVTAAEASSSASSIAKTISKIPVLPITSPSESKDMKKLEEKMADPIPAKPSFIKKPALIFVGGFNAFGLSDSDGIKDMADNLPGSKKFSWDEQDKIIDEIKKHAPDQPVVLVGHGFGGDTAVEIANTFNSLKNGFRSIDLLVSIDSVGMNNTIIPMNVKRNLNFFGEGGIPFLHGSPNVARNTDYTDVQNELRPESHSKMDNSDEVQYKIFEEINYVLGESNHPDLFEEIQKNDQLKKLIGNLALHEKP